ncbi:MAG: hypothetical protein KF688_06710 [Pirellulales bacterium]|nr:hypothetical protein [Pirellulales bacterium]
MFATERCFRWLTATIAALMTLPIASTAPAADLTRAIPVEAHLFVHARHNPEREFLAKHYADVWQTVCDEKIAERLLEIVSGHMKDQDRQKAESLWSDVRTAAAPINFPALAKAEEVVMFQVMEGPANQTTVLVRLSAEDAVGFEEGVIELMKLVERRSGGKVPLGTSAVGDATITAFQFPPQVPMRPAVARKGDVVLLSLYEPLLHRSIEMLDDSASDSKYDDPRVAEALAHLPKPEDAFVFFDGKQLFQRLRGVGTFVASQRPESAEAQRFAQVFSAVIDEFAVLDYEATSQYTDGVQCRSMVYGKLAEDAGERTLGKAFAGGKPFADWHTWVPAGATSYSLSRGINLHELYAGALDLVKREFPEAEPGLARFDELQNQFGVRIDEDVLQSFSGETASVTFPVEQPDGGSSSQSVTALRCSNPDKIRELMHRGVEALKQIPFVAAQQLDVVACSELEGFEEIQCSMLAMVKARPVIGFDDGWLLCGSSPAAVKKFLAVRRGEAASIEAAASLEKFALTADGPVSAVSYCDVGAGVRQAADLVEQAAAVAPMALGMIAAKARPEEIKPIQDLVGLLPSVAKVIRKFDFVEEQLTVTRPGPKPHTYVREAVLLVRSPEKVAVKSE